VRQRDGFRTTRRPARVQQQSHILRRRLTAPLDRLGPLALRDKVEMEALGRHVKEDLGDRDARLLRRLDRVRALLDRAAMHQDQIGLRILEVERDLVLDVGGVQRRSDAAVRACRKERHDERRAVDERRSDHGLRAAEARRGEGLPGIVDSLG